ncbi:hypothetical protein SAMN04488003_10535 [Loktanella fryxellensis]|uniref:Uncharacterized protein n=1 Tax=Loktanella fryxellensis TaxID=245187 RepID=A0A1H8BHB4_9RHOB|nr:hypothetical protein [Loktanella fryxellensis]SEM81849.1 hypothetical protein SAMN04488003_10535 [Loktanella fryxellensis]
MSGPDYPATPDGRYFVAKGRLWRRTDPGLDEAARQQAVNALMQARRAVGQATTQAETRTARDAVDTAKRRLGERGPVWWDDAAPDQGGRHPKNTSYAAWWAALDPAVQDRGL